MKCSYLERMFVRDKVDYLIQKLPNNERNPLEVKKEKDCSGFRFYDCEIPEFPYRYPYTKSNFSPRVLYGQRLNGRDVPEEYSYCESVCLLENGEIIPMCDSDMTYEEMLNTQKELELRLK